MFELTGQYSIILPLMTAVAIAAGTGRLLSRDTIYTAKLWRRGIDLDAAPRPPMTAEQIAQPPPDPLPEDTPLRQVFTADATGEILPIVDADGRYRGCISTTDVKKALTQQDPSTPVAGVLHQPPTLAAQDKLTRILATLSGHETTGLPVVSPDGSRLIGWITYDNVLARIGAEP